jgi:hypothetical protein
VQYDDLKRENAELLRKKQELTRQVQVIGYVLCSRRGLLAVEESQVLKLIRIVVAPTLLLLPIRMTLFDYT